MTVKQTANFAITCAKFDESAEHVTEVQLHDVDPQGVVSIESQRIDKGQLVDLLQQGADILTLPEGPGGEAGEFLATVEIQGDFFVRTDGRLIAMDDLAGIPICED
jgi:hypothetical protein